MSITSVITALVVAMSIPSAITGFCFWLLERKIQQREKAEAEAREKRQMEVDERESARENYEIYII